MKRLIIIPCLFLALSNCISAPQNKIESYERLLKNMGEITFWAANYASIKEQFDKIESSSQQFQSAHPTEEVIDVTDNMVRNISKMRADAKNITADVTEYIKQYNNYCYDNTSIPVIELVAYSNELAEKIGTFYVVLQILSQGYIYQLAELMERYSFVYMPQK